jgi:hypothetical protein
MDNISNRALAILLVTAIIVSLGTTVYTLNKVDKRNYLTGKLSTDIGKVNLTVESTISIVLRGLTVMDFGKGYVNSSCPYVTYANLTVKENGYTDTGDCWTSISGTLPNTPTQPFRIENDGNQNVTLAISCPAADTFFSGYVGGNLHNLSFKQRNNETNSCAAVAGTGNWTACSGAASQTICGGTKFNYADTSDEMAVDFNIVIPDGLSFQEYYNSTITFRAS